MGTITGATSLATQCIGMMASRTPRTFFLTIIAALVLAGVCWFVCTNYSKLWNKRYQITMIHHVLCGIAAVMTLVFTLVYMSLSFTREIAAAAVNQWSTEIHNDNAFKQTTFGNVYNAVRALGIENFSGYPAPPQGRRVPLNHEQSRTLMAKTYGDAACRDFQRKNPFLSRVIWPEAQVPVSAVRADMTNFFNRNPGGTYMDTQAIGLAVKLIRGALEPQTRRVVALSRTTAVMLFLFFQAIPFTVIGYAAYKDLAQSI